jgi:hypothetical protein
MNDSSLVQVRLSLRCSSKVSFELLKVLDDMKLEYKLAEKAALAPVFDEVLCRIIVTVAGSLVVETLRALFRRLAEKDVFVEYETRYEAALRFLEDRRPVICESRDDRDQFSEYVFKTRESRFRWTYDRGEVVLSKVEK